jgi:PIN domain nuclease of toxin-antitoxin system
VAKLADASDLGSDEEKLLRADSSCGLPSHPSTLIPAVREESGIASLSLTEMDALAAEKLQLFQKDPFDRMLIAQAIMGGTCDYHVRSGL